jgi:hypothetical protein
MIEDLGSFEQVDARARDEILAAVAALEIADAPVSGERFQALRDPGMRAQVAAVLSSCGRSLNEVDSGWLSGYDDAVADVLAADGVGRLNEKDSAVLALVLLYTVAIPRARGRITGDNWTQSVPTTIDELQRNRHLTRLDIQRSLRRLRSLGILRPGLRGAIAPGPQFLRLSHVRTRRLWDELIVVSQPSSTLAQMIRKRHGSKEAVSR